jgi:hypothetical protein
MNSPFKKRLKVGMKTSYCYRLSGIGRHSDLKMKKRFREA